ncbi:MAG: hypothetical protein ACOC1I_07325, partial [Spirochaetota bacterium]
MIKRTIAPVLLLFITASLTAQILDRPVAVVRLTETVNIGRSQLDTQLEPFRQQLGRELQENEKQ